MNLRSLNIAPRAALNFFLVTLLVVALGIFALIEMAKMNQIDTELETKWLVSLETSDQIQKLVLRARLAGLKVLVSSPADASVANQTLMQTRQELEKALSFYEQKLLSSPHERELIGIVRTDLSAFSLEQDRGLALHAQGQNEQAVAVVNSTQQQRAEALQKALNEVSEINQKGVAAAGVFAHDTYYAGQIGVGVMIAVALALTVLLAVLLTRSIVRPLGEALRVAEAIAGGNLTAKIVVEGDDEPARLLKALATMQSSLRDTIARIGDSSTQLAAASQEMSAVTLQSTAGLQRQNEEVDQAATAVNQMSAAVEEVARSANAAAEAGRQCDASASTGNLRVQQTLTAIRSLSDRVQGSSQEVQGLATQVKDIAKVVDVIRGIAEQTNLLALNAAIEAARAGEQGRGFAVVADEVRALAHRTQTSTQEIEQMISAIQTGTSKAVDAMGKSSQEAAITLGIADEAGQSLLAITQGISQINQRGMQIATASEEQAHVAREVDRNLMSIRDLSIQSASGGKQTAAASHELAKLATDLSGLVQRFKV